jgi:4-diphosphocytidyl-2-C-methyl-D-erythritol kinase
VTPAGAVTVPSFAKINLGLEVLRIREDGYHELRTLFQTVSLRDDITLRPTDGTLSVSCTNRNVPTDESNIALRAAIELQRWSGTKQGVEIAIRKRIPVEGGLGGGSSNAAAVLMALDRLWGVGAGPEGLLPIARRLGADVPFFLVGGTALGVSRGDEIYPLFDQVMAHCVIVAPGRGLSTAEVFRRLDAGLVPREDGHTIFRFVMRGWNGGAPLALLANDLEAAALDVAPELSQTLRHARSTMIREGATMAALSGSGSSYFGLFPDASSARRARAALAGEGLSALSCRTVTLKGYRRIWARSLEEVAQPGGSTR